MAKDKNANRADQRKQQNGAENRKQQSDPMSVNNGSNDSQNRAKNCK